MTISSSDFTDEEVRLIAVVAGLYMGLNFNLYRPAMLEAAGGGPSDCHDVKKLHNVNIIAECIV